MEKLGFFITIEGSDYAGKSTIVKKLNSKLKKESIPCVITKEPYYFNLNDILIDNSYSIKINPDMELSAFLLDRQKHVLEFIKPKLDNNSVVICDRYIDSTIAYQGFGLNKDIRTLQILNKLATNNLKPNLTFILDIDYSILLERQAIRNGIVGGTDPIEKRDADFFFKVRAGFLYLARSDIKRYYLIDASRTPEEVFNEIYNIIKDKLKQKGYYNE